MSSVTALAGRARALPRARAASLAALAASQVYLLARLAGDVGGKPLFPEESLAGLVAVRPLPEVVATVMWERGGAPVHFVLAHLALLADPSAAALRWLSVVLALAAVAACWDLGRRLADDVAAATAAVVAAASTALGIYGSYGRMYALFVLAAAVALDLFVRAVHLRTTRSAAAAATAAALLPAVHPYGVFLVAAEALVALVLWRGRPLRPALPVLAVGLLLVPFLVASLRLAERFRVGVDAGESLVTPERSWQLLRGALASFAGGEGLAFAFFVGLALAGALALARTETAFVACAALAVAAPPVALMVGSGNVGAGSLLARHLVFALPIWAALAGAGVARGVRALPGPVAALAVAGVAALAVLSPAGGLDDPRTETTYAALSGSREALTGPAAWVRAEVGPDDVLFPYSPVFFAALPETREATAFNRDDPVAVVRALDRVDPPVGAVYVTVPLVGAELDEEALAERLGSDATFAWIPPWLVARMEGPFEDDAAVLAAAHEAVAAAGESASGKSSRVDNFLKRSRDGLAGALRELGEEPRS